MNTTNLQIIYIAASKEDSEQNCFKVGGLTDRKYLQSCLNNYNKNESDKNKKFYYADVFRVFDFKLVEKRLQSLLKRFNDQDDKEIYRMYYPDLQEMVTYVCNNLRDEVNEINKIIQNP
jgi:hypothetical protein